MERVGEVKVFDSGICSYFQKYSQTKKDSVFCYEPDKRQIAEFYSHMTDQFYNANLVTAPDSTRRPTRQSKMKQKIFSHINNPINSALPKDISQRNLISIDKKQTLGTNFQPMFSEVECSKKNNYVIGQEVKSMVTQDIKQMAEDREQEFFRKKFPIKKCKSKSQLQVFNIQTQSLIKNYNRILTKYKNDGNNLQTELRTFEQTNFSGVDEDIALDNQLLNLMGLFKKIYYQTKSEYITNNLLKYMLKFQKEDKMMKKIRSRKVFSSKNNLNNLASGTLPERSTQQYLKRSQLKTDLVSKGNHEGRVSILSQTCQRSKPNSFKSLKQHEASTTAKVKAKFSRFQDIRRKNIKKNKLRL